VAERLRLLQKILDEEEDVEEKGDDDNKEDEVAEGE
jgi:hypothetical protein